MEQVTYRRSTSHLILQNLMPTLLPGKMTPENIEHSILNQKTQPNQICKYFLNGFVYYTVCFVTFLESTYHINSMNKKVVFHVITNNLCEVRWLLWLLSYSNSILSHDLSTFKKIDFPPLLKGNEKLSQYWKAAINHR